MQAKTSVTWWSALTVELRAVYPSLNLCRLCQLYPLLGALQALTPTGSSDGAGGTDGVDRAPAATPLAAALAASASQAEEESASAARVRAAFEPIASLIAPGLDTSPGGALSQAADELTVTWRQSAELVSMARAMSGVKVVRRWDRSADTDINYMMTVTRAR
jgi:hypothetical protein